MTTQPASYTDTIAKPAGADTAAAARPAGPEEPGQDRDELRAIFNVPVNVQVVLGRTTMPVSQLLKLGRGAVVELNRKVGEAVDVFVNDRLIARGEVVIVDDGRLGVTMTEIVKAELSLL
ncbi:flagellar motor switch protein FliN [Rhodocista pekingensis]|uniref:Flagellar motor switch protein FliN n=1 Tax=Rhodocista pekingensis TaxID=201185 RepID=A0ABW2L1J0_9PROT